MVEGRAGAGAWISAACLCLIGFQQHTLTLSIFWGLLFWFLEAGSSIDFSSPLILSPLQSTMDLFVGTKSRYSNFSMACFAFGWVTATKLSLSSHPHITIVTKISIFWFSRGWLCCWVPSSSQSTHYTLNLNSQIFQGLALLLGSFLHRRLQELFSLLPPLRTIDGGEVHHQGRNIISPKRKVGLMSWNEMLLTKGNSVLWC